MINHWLINEGGLDITDGEVIGLCAESHCEYHSAVAFPDVDRCRAAGSGTSVAAASATSWRCSAPASDSAAAVGWFVHVFVDRERRRPVEIPAGMRARSSG